jgi:hypothetical protein
VPGNAGFGEGRAVSLRGREYRQSRHKLDVRKHLADGHQSAPIGNDPHVSGRQWRTLEICAEVTPGHDLIGHCPRTGRHWLLITFFTTKGSARSFHRTTYGSAMCCCVSPLRRRHRCDSRRREQRMGRSQGHHSWSGCRDSDSL